MRVNDGDAPERTMKTSLNPVLHVSTRLCELGNRRTKFQDQHRFHAHVPRIEAIVFTLFEHAHTASFFAQQARRSVNLRVMSIIGFRPAVSVRLSKHARVQE
jgi:hypothetical protein